MSVRVLLRQAVALRLCARSRCRPAYPAERLSSGWKNEEESEAVQQPSTGGTAERCTLVYNPSVYYQSRSESSACRGGSTNQEEAFRQRSDQYSVNSSRSLSSSKNTRLSLGSRNEAKSEDNLKRDTRAFQRCRPEYRSVSHDTSRRPPALPLKDGLFLLHQATLRRENTRASGVAHSLCELGRLEPEQAPVVRGSMRFSMLLRHSVENLPNFTVAQLAELLRAFVRLGLPHSHGILGSYEAEFSQRLAEMDLHQMLLVADLWRCLGRSVPQYVEKMCDHVNERFDQMGVPELVQFVYILGESRQCPAYLLPSLEGVLMRHLDQLKGEEVGAVCLGLFKTQSSVSERTARRIVDRACSVVREMSDFGVVNVLKLMRFCHLDHLPWLEALSSEVPRRAPHMAVQGLMHVALTCSALHYRDDRILLSVAEHLPHQASFYRSKDAAKLLWAFGNLGILPSKCPSLHPRLAEALRERQSEFRSYPEHLLTALLGLAFVSQFPHDLLSLVLSPEFSNQVTSTFDLKKDLFTLDGTVELELPSWTGPRLSLVTREEVTKQLWDFARTELCLKPEVLEAEAALQELLGGTGFVRKGMILPHMRSIDLEVHLNLGGQPLPVSSEPHVSSVPETFWPQGWDGRHAGVTLTDDLLAQLTSGRKIPSETSPASTRRPVLRPVEAPTERESVCSVGVDLTDDLMRDLTKSRVRPSLPSQVTSPVRLAVQVTSRNHYCYRTHQLLGLHAMKRRQLALAGYTVVEVPHWEWFPLLRRSLPERLAYMHCKIFSSYDSKRGKKK